jgi:hypothetical protein
MPSTRKLFVGLVVLALLLLLIFRFLLGDHDWPEIAGDILESLISTFVAALGIAIFLRFFVPRDPGIEVNLIEPRDLQDEFPSLLQEAMSWKYKGNFGRYFRTSVLSVLSRRVNEKHIAVEVECMVIDPDNVKLCELHASSRNAVRAADGKQDWTVRDVRVEVYATILCCFIYKNTLNIRLGLLNYFESPRFDISPESIIITREDKKAPAVKINKESYLFHAIVRDYHVAMSQSRVINLQRNNLSLKEIDHKKAAEILIGADLDKDFINSEIKAICDQAAKKENPYTY